jgi:hypothetical protein
MATGSTHGSNHCGALDKRAFCDGGRSHRVPDRMAIDRAVERGSIRSVGVSAAVVPPWVFWALRSVVLDLTYCNVADRPTDRRRRRWDATGGGGGGMVLWYVRTTYDDE